MNFALFILLNAVLLIRPEELQPDIAGARLYLIVTSLNVAAALPLIADVLRPDQLARRPLTLLVLGLLGATAISQLAHGDIDAAFDFAADFSKVVIYYLLLVAIINTPYRLRLFIGFLILFIAVLAILGLLQYHGVIDHDALRPVEQKEYDPATGQLVAYPRLCSAGIFHDPNDLCLMLTLGIICCLYHAATTEYILGEFLWLPPIILFGYAMVLTKSRGGLLGLMGALTAFVAARYGWRRALLIAGLGAPVALAAVGGRQANISLSNEDTGYARVMLWGQGLSELARRPKFWLTGIGAGEYREEAGLTAHNSFVQAYVELGLLGGTMFGVAFISAVRMLYRFRRPAVARLPRMLAPFPPFLLAIVVGYCGGMFSLSRNYVIPTYLCLGLAQAYLTMVMPDPPEEFRLSRRWMKQTVLMGVGGLLFLKLVTQAIGQLWT